MATGEAYTSIHYTGTGWQMCADEDEGWLTTENEWLKLHHFKHYK